MEFNKKELEIVQIGVEMYKAKLKKMLKDSVALKAGEKEVKIIFLETERLIEKVSKS